MENEGRRILIVGGVAGGASAAARARRLCEHCTIVVFDRGPFVSFANCGLPYYVGNVIENERDLLVATPELFRQRFDIDVRVEHEVLAIDREAKRIHVRNLRDGKDFDEAYDALILSPGAKALRPPLEGIDLPGIFVLRTIPDSRKIRAWIDETRAKRAVIIGGGFIGLEMAENLVHRGLQVHIVEMAPQLLPPVDPEMAVYVQEELEGKGVALHLGESVRAFTGEAGASLAVHTKTGTVLPADLVILAMGVRPETRLAKEAGLELGPRGGIRVDAQMRSSDPHIWAVGDAVEVSFVGSDDAALVPLAGPANRQGRIAADAIFGRSSNFRGVQGTAVCGVFDLTVAASGMNEKTLRRAGMTNFETIYLHPGHHAGYYPGAKPIHMKLLFSVPEGRILGVQAVGAAGVERRVDVLSMAMQKEATVFDLEEAELCYAPQFGAAKDPVNLAGMIAANVLRGDMPLAQWEDLPTHQGLLLDVREEKEFAAGHLEGAIHLPLSELRQRLDELDSKREIWVYCGVGQRGYYATRLLNQRGFRARNLSGGITTARTYGGNRS